MTSTPLFSVIIPAYNVLAYLRQAVASVAAHPRAEVIVVDDISTDGTSELADELAESNANVTVVRPEVNGGLGRARNLGMASAKGTDLLVLDSDDYFVDGALDEIEAAIEGVDPDVVQFGYARLFPSGRRQEGIRRAPLQIPGSFTAAEHPEIYGILNVAWNKAYRRAKSASAGRHRSGTPRAPDSRRRHSGSSGCCRPSCSSLDTASDKVRHTPVWES